MTGGAAFDSIVSEILMSNTGDAMKRDEVSTSPHLWLDTLLSLGPDGAGGAWSGRGSQTLFISPLSACHTWCFSKDRPRPAPHEETETGVGRPHSHPPI